MSLEDKLLGRKSLGGNVLVAVFNCMLKGLCHKNTSVLNQFCAEVWKIIIIIIIIIISSSSSSSNGYRTGWSPTSMITNRIGRRKVLLPINHNFNKICDIISYFFNQNTRKSKFCFASSEKKRHLSARVMARTVLLNCPIKAEIRAVDSQSDLTILL